MSYQVGIDLGTTYSAAAVCRPGGDGRSEVVPLGDRAASVASVVFVVPDGSLVVGEAAQRRALTDPDRVVREFKRRIGDGTPLVVGGEPVAAEVVAARFVGWMLDRVAEREGGPASRVAVTHPAGWGPHKRESFTAALAEQGLDSVVFLSEPQAAAVGYSSAERVAPGSVVGVYDLGGGTFDAAVVRKVTGGGFEVLGRPEGIERLGGVDFDEAVFEHVRVALGQAMEGLDPADPAVLAAVAGLRRECTAAKEALSADTEVTIPVMLPGAHTQVRLVRAEFEDMVRPAVADTVEALRRAIGSAGVDAGELDAVLLVGGSSRIPLVAQLVSAELGRPVAVDTDPKTTIALGAALAARGPEPAEDTTTPMNAVIDEEDAASPSRPPRAPAPLPVGQDESPPGWRARTRTLVLAGAVAVIALAGTAVGLSGGNPAGSTEAVGEKVAAAGAGPARSAGSDAAASGSGNEIDSWTGAPRTETTTPGPKRPAARPAASPPGTRTAGNPAPAARPGAGGGNQAPRGSGPAPIGRNIPGPNPAPGPG
ncbi:MAG: Hsp70 family protein, partial [Pseudonocardiaceae bacterium]